MPHDTRTVFQSPHACIQDFRCDGRCHQHTKREECTDAHELVFVRHGAWVRRDAGGRRLADAGQLVFFNRGAPYEIEHPLGGDECTIVSFPADVILRTAGDLGLCVADAERPFARGSVPLPATMQWLHRQLLASRTSLERDELALEILGQSLEASQDRPQFRNTLGEADRRELAHAASVALARDYRQPVTLAALAAELGCSRFHLARAFRQWSGRSIHQHLIELRLAAALQDLCTTTRPVSEIAHDLGFFDHAHFTTTFTRHFGSTPSNARAAAQPAKEWPSVARSWGKSSG